MPTSCAKKFDLVLILDSSGSVGRTIWPKEVDFAKKLVNEFTIGEDKTHIGIIDFSSRSIVRVDINKPEARSNDTVQLILDQLKSEFQSGVTYIDLALKSAIKMFNEIPSSRDNVTKLLIIVTDGQATKRQGKTGFELMLKPIEILQSKKIERISIGVGSNVKTKELALLASDKDKVIRVANFFVLTDKVRRILDAFCPKPLGE